jgi:asparagine synthase (glutamine-hydrolysing)
MHETLTPPLATGTPTFLDAPIADLAARQGLLPAWQALLGADIAAALNRVQGDFALGIQLADGSTLLAVDRFAVQTLCWRMDGGQLQFASRADELAGTSGSVENQALFDYMYLHTIASPRTIFKGVFRLPPGHYAICRGTQVTVAPYWVPKFKASAGRPDFAQLAGEFRALLKGAVAARLDGGQPACFLSGGTDSSTVVGMVREATGRAPVTYSIGFEAEGYDEMAFARIAAKHFGAEHREYYVTPDDLVKRIPDLAAACDQPFGNSSLLPAYFCALEAKQGGATRMLAGDGGDELFGGNSRYAKQKLFGLYDMAPPWLRHGLVEPLLGSRPATVLPGLKKAASYVEQAKVPMPDRLQIYNLLIRLGLSDVLAPAFLAAVDAQAPLKQQRVVWAAPETGSDINRTLAYDWRYTLAEADLPKVRTATQHAGLDVAYPMLDTKLLEFSMSLPVSYKLKGLKLRWFFKEALRGFLPDEVINKKKQGFGLPYGVWLTRHEGLKKQAQDALSTLSERGFVKPQFVTQLIREKLPEHPVYYGEMIWILSIAEHWLRQHKPDFRFVA